MIVNKMIIGIGTDIVDVGRITNAVEQYGERFLKKIYTEIEREYCERYGPTRFLHYAARFAAKEAFSKAIGTGMRDGFSFNLVGIRNEPSGNPRIELSGVLKDRWENHRILTSLSHTSSIAVAVVTIESVSNERKNNLPETMTTS